MSTLRKSIIVFGMSIGLTSSAHAEDLMRDRVSGVSSASCTIDQAGHAKLVGRPGEDLIKLLEKYPQGRQSLTDALVAILDADPDRAAEVVALSRMANKKQKAAIAKALFEVDSRLHKISPKIVTPIAAALPCADSDLRSALSALGFGSNSGDANSGDTNFGGSPGRPFGTGSTGSVGAVSPN